MRQISTVLIGIGTIMLLGVLGLLIWLVWEIGFPTIRAAPGIQINLGLPGVVYFGVAFVSLFLGLWLRKKHARLTSDAVS